MKNNKDTGRFKFNREGICQNPDEFKEYVGPYVTYKILVAFHEPGWLCGYDLIVSSLTTGSNAISETLLPSVSTIYNQKNDAILETGLLILKKILILGQTSSKLLIELYPDIEALKQYLVQFGFTEHHLLKSSKTIMKKFIISTDALKPILAKVGQAVGKNTTLPVLSDMYCKVSKGEVEFISTDLELTIIHKCPAETTGYLFELLIPFDYFKSIVNLSSHQPLSLELAGKGETKAVILCEGEKYELNELDSTVSFPKMPEIPKRNTIELDKDFISWTNKALTAVSKDELRPAMTKVCLDVEENRTTIVSTDAHCLITKSFNLESKVVDQLLISPKIAKALNGLEKATLSWSKSHIAFHSGGFTIVATRIDDKYPSYKVVMPNTERNLSVAKNTIINSLEKCGLSTDKSKKTTMLLNKHAGKIVLESIDEAMNRAMTFDVEADFTGDTEFVVINSDLMMKMISILDDGQIHLHIKSASKGIMISAEEDKTYLGMVMPLMM